MIAKPCLVPATAIAALLFSALSNAGQEVAPVDLRCEYLASPLGIDAAQPRLSWRLQCGDRGRRQTAYRVLAASDLHRLSHDEGDLWDSGKVASDQSIQVPYAGKPLTSRTRCHWKVRLWDEKGTGSAWSQPALWTMGLLVPEDWKAQWIGATDDQGAGAILLRKELSLPSAPVRATATICGLGYYELYVNGRRVGDHVLDPGYTDYNRRALYVTYDVTEFIRQGQNAVGVNLGNGWLNLPTPDIWGFHTAPWRAPPKLLFTLLLEFPDGKQLTVASDGTWKWSTGPITFNCVRGGETYDARLEQPGWNAVGFDAAAWKPAKVVPPPRGRLVAQCQEPIRAVASIRPVAVTEPKPGLFVFDMGTGIAGWAKLATSGAAGKKITLRFGERLHPNGTLDTELIRRYTFGRFQTEEFILRGQGIEVFEPRFTYHGFRYVEVAGLTTKPTLETLTGRWVHSDVQPVGEFACSDQRLNRLYETIRRTHLCGMFSIPTDCPHREKLGWTIEGCDCIEMALCNFGMAPFYSKWLRDILDAQEPNGHSPIVAPSNGWCNLTVPVQPGNGRPGDYDDPWLGGAIANVPWMLYQYYGDSRALAEAYDGIRRYVEWLQTTAREDVLPWGLGDWGEEGFVDHVTRTSANLTSTCGYYHCVSVLGRAAEILGKPDEAKRYLRQAETIRASFNRRFLDATSGRYAPDSQTAQAMPLWLGMVPPESNARVVERLVENILQTRRGHVSAGMLGTGPLVHALLDARRADVAWTMLSREDYPGWLHMLNQGATTLWEFWTPNFSLNHPDFGIVGIFFYQGIGGIRPDKAGPGFKRFIVAPEPVGDLKWAHTQFRSLHGPIATDWKRDGQQFTLELAVPPNTTATLYLPARDAQSARQIDFPIGARGGATLLRHESGRAVYAVPSGKHRFASQLPW